MSRSDRMTQLNRNGAIVWFDDFDGPNRHSFLSNFYVGDPLYVNMIGDEPYATGEHLFAALKTTNVHDHVRVRDEATPQGAKTLGRRVQLRDDWERIKYDVMRLVLRVKFSADRPEARMLVNTGDALLVEGTNWNDRVWGVDVRRDEPYPGRNWLGTLLMARRAELRALEVCGWEPDVVELLRFVLR